MLAVTSLSSEVAQHNGRVHNLAVRVCEQLDIATPDVRSILQVASSLHDAGKLAIPFSILSKPGPLTNSEYRIVKQHAAIGANLLAGIGAGREIIAAIRHHHEWWNGCGYPDGLAGSAIPLTSRIIAVADAYDAMTSNRPFRQSMAKSKATDELIAGAGTQFDPDLVSILLELLR